MGKSNDQTFYRTLDNQQVPLFSKACLPDGDWIEFKKIPTTKMLRMHRPFAVETIHGGEPQVCGAGGWLALDADGYPYPIDHGIHQRTFVRFGSRMGSFTDSEVRAIREGAYRLLPAPAAQTLFEESTSTLEARGKLTALDTGVRT